MNHILAVVTISHALQCLAFALMKGKNVAKSLLERSDKIEHEAQQSGLDEIRRVVEGLWFLLYFLIAYRLWRM